VVPADGERMRVSAPDEGHLLVVGRSCHDQHMTGRLKEEKVYKFTAKHILKCLLSYPFSRMMLRRNSPCPCRCRRRCSCSHVVLLLHHHGRVGHGRMPVRRRGRMTPVVVGGRGRKRLQRAVMGVVRVVWVIVESIFHRVWRHRVSRGRTPR
jgi:hypothetical protein